MVFQNRTPHSVGLIGEDGTTRILAPITPAVRIAVEPGVECARIDGVPILSPSRFVRLTHLPEPADGTILIVSQLCALAIAATQPGRNDVVYPATRAADGARRDKLGVIGVRRLIRAA